LEEIVLPPQFIDAGPIVKVPSELADSINVYVIVEEEPDGPMLVLAPCMLPITLKPLKEGGVKSEPLQFTE
jgi:hypothetical protein